MRNIILVLMFLSLYDYSIADIKYHLEIGNALEYHNVNYYIYLYDNTEETRNYDYVFATLKFGYSFNFLLNHLIYIENTTWSGRNDSIRKYKPFRHIYSVGYELKYDKIILKLFHFCNHPVDSVKYSKSQKWFNNFWEEDITTLSVAFSNW